jgi:predicted nucleic acid-binding protein
MDGAPPRDSVYPPVSARRARRSVHVNDAPALLDTSALLAVLEDEPGADEVVRRLKAADQGEGEIFASFASLTELQYLTEQEHGPQRAAEITALVRAWPMRIIFPDAQLCLEAGRLKAGHAISFADAFIAATAISLGAELVHKDPEYESLATHVRLRALPYKPRKSR